MSDVKRCNAKIAEIIYLLKDENRLLKNGKFDAIEAITEKKRRGLQDLNILMSALGTDDTVKYIIPQMEELKRLSRTNGIILESVVNGLKAAQNRLMVMRNQTARVGAYDRRGSKLFLSEDTVSSEKTV